MSITEAETFLFTHARVLDRRRFALLFGDGDAESVVCALDAYRNPDGGYGHALEPDGRGPDSQPLAALTALHILREAGALASRAASVIGFLEKCADADGAVPFAVPAGEYPHSPWWQASEVGGLLPTANLVGALAGVEHPWITRAAEYCWPRIEALTSTHPYEVRACLLLLDSAADRPRAVAAAARLGELVRSSRLVRLGSDAGAAPEGYTSAELPYPHEYAPRPDSLAADWFTDAELVASLDALVAERADGGWRPRWLIWTPVVEHDWSGPVTIEALTTLRAHGREL